MADATYDVSPGDVVLAADHNTLRAGKQNNILYAGETETGVCGGGCRTYDDLIANSVKVTVNFRKELEFTPSSGNIALNAGSSNSANVSAVGITKYGFILDIVNTDGTGYSTYNWYGTYTVTCPAS